MPPPHPRPNTVQRSGPVPSNDASALNNENVTELFIDPILGSPLMLYIAKDVDDREELVHLIQKYGGIVVQSYTTSTYLLVDPRKEYGKSLYLQYAGKKGKVILDVLWVRECVKRGQLQTYQNNFAGCKVMGERSEFEEAAHGSVSVPEADVHHHSIAAEGPPVGAASGQTPNHVPVSRPSDLIATSSVSNSHSFPPSNSVPPAIRSDAYSYPPPPMERSPHPESIQYWPNATSMIPGVTSTFEDANQRVQNSDYQPIQQTWDASANPLSNTGAEYEYQWAPPVSFYHDSNEGHFSSPPEIRQVPSQAPRSRKRKRVEDPPQSTPPSVEPLASRLVTPRAPLMRSPSPPTRVLRSTHGGNLFTEEDITYLQRYIDYCQNHGLTLSLREICERVAIKAPHHTFYSWRRYCNKHQIRLGGYAMDEMALPSPHIPDESPSAPEMDLNNPANDPAGASVERSPSPPRVLFRSTTGKGIAFTEADVNFLTQHLRYSRGKTKDLNMVQFWKTIAEKAPHHSRASWMKYWRRHKHELEGEGSMPPPPEKKKKYDANDDLILARFFLTKHKGTSDAIFQDFARQNPHHPWKGWQEHHRLHKAKIDHLIEKLRNGEIELRQGSSEPAMAVPG
ncbi:hypothetical protein SISNIDRAFT_448644 [Sistotremastrum niveocremeum HHB9708]|uniref:BRCT domain-containing protein n=1 Tax=Sistotremastrum niveocremeum HHB9708 TaxID=1314777 RepID=A0A165A332_9AGAM|nr:hypothetical protein SISNIDRAFT_448644 [Sistotremastrum niveocremeum HHB9708]